MFCTAGKFRTTHRLLYDLIDRWLVVIIKETIVVSEREGRSLTSLSVMVQRC